MHHKTGVKKGQQTSISITLYLLPLEEKLQYR